MPLFDFTCDACSATFETLVRGGERPRCPQCRGTRLTRHLSAAAVHGAASTNSLPVCQEPSGPPCGPGFCRTGQCELD